MAAGIPRHLPGDDEPRLTVADICERLPGLRADWLTVQLRKGKFAHMCAAGKRWMTARQFAAFEAAITVQAPPSRDTPVARDRARIAAIVNGTRRK